MTRLYNHRKSHINGRIAIGIGRYVTRANEGLSLAITQGVTQRVLKKFYSEGCTRCAIQTALNIDVTATADD